jgi:hypothetical protein
MAMAGQPQQAGVGRAGMGVLGAAAEDRRQPTAARLTTEQIWQQLAKASFAVLGYVTPAGSHAPAGWSTRPPTGGSMWPWPPPAGRPGTSRPAVGWR